MPIQQSGNNPVIVPVPSNSRNIESFDLLQLHQLNPVRYPYLLQSTAHLGGQPSFDILFACPQLSLELAVDGTQKIRTGYKDRVKQTKSIEENITFAGTDFLQSFERLWRLHSDNWEGDCGLPFCGGWFLFLSYELSRQIEPRLQELTVPVGAHPAAVATRIPVAIVRDHLKNQFHIVIEKNYQSLLPAIQDDIDKVLQDPQKLTQPDRVTGQNAKRSIIKSISEDEPLKYLDNVERIKEYIREGDVFQVNLSRQWQADLVNNIDASEIYRRLRQSNPAPFFALADFGDMSIISSSPERLVKVQGSQVETRPIAGTRPRGNTRELDQAKLDELIAHPKERAEHIMLIDLERNDLGRVCVPGSVTVNELMVLETYSHVHHIVSNVQGKLKATTTPSDVIRAVFPGGTITGCPKVRCMEIITELEHCERGAYTGSLGYVNHSGDLDLNILIRTLVKQAEKLSFRAGAGIVADSDPKKELEETRAKAKGLILAL